MPVQQTITFTNSAAAQIATVPTFVKDLRVEPVRSNTHVCYVGTSALAQNGSAGVISDLAVPAASNGILDRFTKYGTGSERAFDVSELYVWGTATEGVKVTYWPI